MPAPGARALTGHGARSSDLEPTVHHSVHLPATAATAVIGAAAAAVMALSQPDATALPASPPTHAAPPSATWEARYAAALREHDTGQLSLAFAGLAQLADEGHCQAARDALRMVEHGRARLGTSLRAGPKQLWRWQSLRWCVS